MNEPPKELLWVGKWAEIKHIPEVREPIATFRNKRPTGWLVRDLSEYEWIAVSKGLEPNWMRRLDDPYRWDRKTHLCGLPVEVHPEIPEGEIWLVRR